MTDPGLPDLPEPQDTPPGGDPGSVPEQEDAPDTEDVEHGSEEDPDYR